MTPSSRAPSLVARAVLLAAAVASPVAASAADATRKVVGVPIGEMAGRMASQLPAATKALEGGSLLVGAYMGVSGLARLRAASTAVHGARYAEGAWKLAVGTGLAILPFVADSATRTAGLGGVLAARFGIPH